MSRYPLATRLPLMNNELLSNSSHVFFLSPLVDSKNEEKGRKKKTNHLKFYILFYLFSLSPLSSFIYHLLKDDILFVL